MKHNTNRDTTEIQWNSKLREMYSILRKCTWYWIILKKYKIIILNNLTPCIYILIYTFFFYTSNRNYLWYIVMFLDSHLVFNIHLYMFKRLGIASDLYIYCYILLRSCFLEPLETPEENKNNSILLYKTICYFCCTAKCPYNLTLPIQCSSSWH